MSSKNLIQKETFFEDINKNVIGVDEVGRGALCGPVVSCAVMLNQSIKKNDLFFEINDSKKLNINKRILLSEFIKKKSIYSFGLASNKEIDKMNILQASLLAMKRAIYKLKKKPSLVLIDGNKIPEMKNYNMRSVIKGDQKIPSISAASIIAKVTRDKMITNLGKKFKGYYWDQNYGYGTKQHLKAIKNLGITKQHRKTFSPINKLK